MNHVLICICLCLSPFYILLVCLAFLSRSKDSSSESWQPLKDSLIWELWDLGVLFTALPQILLLFFWRFLKVWFGLDFAVFFFFLFFLIFNGFSKRNHVLLNTLHALVHLDDWGRVHEASPGAPMCRSVHEPVRYSHDASCFLIIDLAVDRVSQSEDERRK